MLQIVFIVTNFRLVSPPCTMCGVYHRHSNLDSALKPQQDEGSDFDAAERICMRLRDVQAVAEFGGRERPGGRLPQLKVPAAVQLDGRWDQGGAIRPKNSCRGGCNLTPKWRQKLTPRIQFETTLVSLYYEEKREGHFITVALKPLQFENESDESTFSCYIATKKMA